MGKGKPYDDHVRSRAPKIGALLMRDDLRRHISRTGNDHSMAEDAATNFTMQITSGLLDVVEAALRDEGVDQGVIRRVLDLIIYGAVPNRGEVAMRQEMLRKLTDAEMNSIKSALLVQPVVPPQGDDINRHLRNRIVWNPPGAKPILDPPPGHPAGGSTD